MYIYTLVEELPIGDGFERKIILKTKDREYIEKEIQKNTGKRFSIAEIEKETKKIYGLSKEKGKLIYKKPLTNFFFLEVEYYPIDEILSEIEQMVNKRVKINKNNLRKIRMDRSKKQIILKQYNPDNRKKKKKSMHDTIFTFTIKKKKNEESPQIESLLQNLITLWNDYVTS